MTENKGKGPPPGFVPGFGTTMGDKESDYKRGPGFMRLGDLGMLADLMERGFIHRGDFVDRLKDGLRQAKAAILSQQKRMLILNSTVERMRKDSFRIGTVTHIETAPYKPILGERFTILAGEFVGSEAVLVNLRARGGDLIVLPKGGEPEGITLKWRKWHQVIRPVHNRRTITSVMVSVNGAQIEAEQPHDLRLQVGQRVRISPETLQIVGVIDHPSGGDLTSVVSILNKQTCEVELQGMERAVLMGRFAQSIKPGDRVQLDEDANIVVQVFPKGGTTFSDIQATHVDWNDIGGQDEAKQALEEALLSSFRNPELYRQYGMKTPKGLLIWGPPGCGKTSLAKAVASEIARLYGGAAKGGFIYFSGSEILNKWLGNSEATIRKVFDQARTFKKKHGYPAVICIDEAEAVMRRRGGERGHGFMDTIVPTFLAEMDGLHESGAIVILLTNRPDVLDPAITRDGRIDRKIQVKRPDHDAVNDIFRIYLRHLPLAKNCTVDSLAAFATKRFFSENLTLETAQTDAGTFQIPLHALRSGSLVEGIVQSAQRAAFRRDMECRMCSGLSTDDLAEAIMEKLRENRDLEHPEAFEEYLIACHRASSGDKDSS